MRYSSMFQFEGAVSQDGSLMLNAGQNQLTGKSAGGKFEGSVGGRRCQYVLSLTR